MALDGRRFEVLVVDDGSSDDTALIAAGAGAQVVRQPYNKGNGAAVKAGIRAAQGDILVLMDGDGQHDAADILRLVAPIVEDGYDMVVGLESKAARNGTDNWPILFTIVWPPTWRDSPSRI